MRRMQPHHHQTHSRHQQMRLRRTTPPNPRQGKPVSTEKHVRYTTDVTTLTEAWTFIMGHVDEYATPTIGIEAWERSSYNEDADRGEASTGYTASIHGYVNA